MQSLVARDQSHRVSQREVVDPRSTAGSVAAHNSFRANRLRRDERLHGIEQVGKDDVDGDGECVNSGKRSAEPQTRCGPAGPPADQRLEDADDGEADETVGYE